MDQTFQVGDKVRLKDGDGRTHIIKKILWEYNLRGERQFAIVIFEDNAAKGFISDDGYTDMVKID
jgi:hypothetical protein